MRTTTGIALAIAAWFIASDPDARKTAVNGVMAILDAVKPGPAKEAEQ